MLTIQLNKKNSQLELPLEEFNITDEIKRKKRWNQSLFNIHKGISKEIYKPREANKTYKDKNGNIIGFSVSLNRDLKEEYILYKEYSKENKKTYMVKRYFNH
jgi:hypothetical protein